MRTFFIEKMLFATLQEKKRLFRKFNVVTPEGIFEVIYNGGKLGTESISVEGEIVASTLSDLHTRKVWFTPKFKFRLGSLLAVVKISVSWRMAVEAFSLEVGGQEVYGE